MGLERQAALMAVVLFFYIPTASIAARPASALGAGATECGKYLAMRADNNEYANIGNAQWISGYINAYNHFSTGPQVSPPGWESILAYMDKYCKEKPLSVLIGGTVSLIVDLGGDVSK